MTEHLYYQPPKSSAFGHSPKKRNPVAAWEATQQFLARHARGQFRASTRAQTVGPRGFGCEKMVFQSQQRAYELFGEPVESGDHWCAWNLGPSDISAAMELFFQAHQHHRKIVSSFRLSLCFDFRWSHLQDATIEGSSLGLVINDYQGIFLQPTFVFPFAWNDLQHREWLGRVINDAPFRFSEQHFKRAIPTKAGNRYRMLNLPRDWRGAT